MSARLHEFEFGTQVADRSAELEERLLNAERKLADVTIVRDQAVQQVEEMRTLSAAQKLAHQAELTQAVAAASAAATNSAAAATGGTEGPDGASNSELEQLREQTEKVQAQLEMMEARHSDEIKKHAQLYRDEAEYLKRKNEEKDRKIQALICERNTLRFESADQQKAGQSNAPAASAKRSRATSSDSLPDLEDGLTS